MKFWMPFLLIVLSFPAKAQKQDVRLLNALNGPSTRYDHFWLGVTHSAMPLSLATPLGMYAYGYSQHNSFQKKQALVTTGAMAINTLLTVSLKWSIDRKRPFVDHPEIFRKTKAGSPSFPSGHTSLAFTTATSLTLAYPKWYVALPAYTWAAAVGYSRMHLGVHYPSDVLAGAIVGTLSSLVAYKLNQKMGK